MKDKLELTGVCWFEDIGFGDITLCYTEHACDHYSSNIETAIDIDKATAENIIGCLQDKFNLKPNAPADRPAIAGKVRRDVGFQQERKKGMKTTYAVVQIMVAIEHDDKAMEDDLMDFADDITSDLRVHQSRYGAMGAMNAKSVNVSMKFDVEPNAGIERPMNPQKEGSNE